MSSASMSAMLKQREEDRLREKERIQGLIDAKKREAEGLRQRHRGAMSEAEAVQQFVADFALHSVVMLVAAIPPDAAFGVAVHLFAHFQQIKADFIPADNADARRDFERFQRFAAEALNVARAKPVPTPPEHVAFVRQYAEMLAHGMPSIPWSIITYEEFLLQAIAGSLDVLPPAVKEIVNSPAYQTTRERAKEIHALFATFPQ